jgi:hypothetical protein
MKDHSEHREACRLMAIYGECMGHQDIVCGNSKEPHDGKTIFQCPGPDSSMMRGGPKNWSCLEEKKSAEAWLKRHPEKKNA